MLDAIVDKGHLDRERTLMVGDRLDTDIAFGRHGGLATLLVLTGVTKEAEVEGRVSGTIPAASDHPLPDYVIGSLGDLLG